MPCSYKNRRFPPANNFRIASLQLHFHKNFVERLITHPFLCFLQELKLKQHFLAFKTDKL